MHICVFRNPMFLRWLLTHSWRVYRFCMLHRILVNKKIYKKFIHACWIFSIPCIMVDGGVLKIYHTIRLEKFASWWIKVFYMKYVWVMIYETCTWWWWFNVHKLFDITFIWKIELHIIFGNLMYEERIHIDFLPQLLVF